MTIEVNQNPEQKARDKIDTMLIASGWVVQHKDRINFRAGKGIAIREYQCDEGFIDYALFIDKKPVGVIEAKREEEGVHLKEHEAQAEGYAKSQLKHFDNELLPFVYESTGEITLFADFRYTKGRSREIFSFQRPETLEGWIKEERCLRTRLHDIPELNPEGLRDAQVNAIENLEESFRDNKPHALIQMATGAGKTFTACTFTYRLLKFAKAKRVLFLVDTKNLGEQAEQEFQAFQPTDDNRKFTELYNVQRLTSSFIPTDTHVCISTIQRVYSILKGKELPEEAEEIDPEDLAEKEKDSKKLVEYNERVPIELFDFVIIDECHRSIYNLWRQVLDYFDSFMIGLTATPDQRTYAFFNENVVSEYDYDTAVADGVNVPNETYIIETEITKNGSELKAKENLQRRDKLTRKKRWEQLDDDMDYGSNKLDKEIVNPSQIRSIIKEFKKIIPRLFPERKDDKGIFEIPKTLVFAKTDSHADDIIGIIREEFGEGNDFCKKVTYKVNDEDPKSILNQFRNGYNPRIAVTVDMIATGTDVKPLEVLLFMRNVNSKNYYEQMKGRGARTIGYEDFKKTSSTAKFTKTHFVIVDAVGVTRSPKKCTTAIVDTKKSEPLSNLLNTVMMGRADEDVFMSLASRLIRLEKKLEPKQQEKFTKLNPDGKNLKEAVKDLINTYDVNVIEREARKLLGVSESEEIPEDDEAFENAQKEAQEKLIDIASDNFTGEINEFLENARRLAEQIIDDVNRDVVTHSDFAEVTLEQSADTVSEFESFIAEHRDEVTALRIFYSEPYRRKEVTLEMIEELFELLRENKPKLSPEYVWEAYARLDNTKGTFIDKFTALVSLIRRASGIDKELTAFNETINRNFKTWVFRKQSGNVKFNEEQMSWLRLIKDHISNSFHIDEDDLDLTPFDGLGGRGRMYQLFAEEYETIFDEINEALAI